MNEVDYAFYKEVYHGTMSEEDFCRLSVPAKAYVGKVTFGRAESYDTDNQVQLAICSAADAFLLNERGGGVVSETVGKISRNYAAGISNTPTEEQRLNQAVSLYLSNTGLLYRGW